jgi:hypothetical protein
MEERHRTVYGELGGKEAGAGAEKDHKAGVTGHWRVSDAPRLCWAVGFETGGDFYQYWLLAPCSFPS